MQTLGRNFSSQKGEKREESLSFFFFLIGLMVNIKKFPQIVVTIKSVNLAIYMCVYLYMYIVDLWCFLTSGRHC